LIVEDEYTSRMQLKNFFMRYGECVTVENGIDAINAFKTSCTKGKRYKLVCLDIMLPGMNGQEVL